MPEIHNQSLAGLSGPQIYASAERNTKGWNYSASVTGAATPEQAVQLLMETIANLEAELARRPLNG